MRSPLLHVIVLAAMLPMTAAAQVPPRPEPALPAPAQPPSPPNAPQRPSKAQRPAPAQPLIEWHGLADLAHDIELARPAWDELRFKADEMRWHADEMRFEASKLAMIDMDAVRASAKAAVSVDAHAVKAMAAEAAASAWAAVEPMRAGVPWTQDRLLNARPREPWAQEDPADSLYRVAREALTRGEYRRAALTFNEVTRKYPRSTYAYSSAYWEAFSRYRIGTTDELRLALRILDGKGDSVSLQSSNGRVKESEDIPALRARVLGALAARGDRDAAARVEQENATRGNSCDREDVSVRAEALSALGQMDIAAAMPTVRKVLARRDECTVELRRRALYMVGRQPGAEGTAIILDVAKNDPDQNIRGEAMRWLPRVAGDAAVPQLEELLRTSADEPSQRAAISALGAIDSDPARRAVRTIIERNDANERVRREAIMSLSRDRENRAVSPDDMNYLRGLYGKMPTPSLKEAVLTSVSRIPGPENEQFLLSIARNVNEPASLRASALQRLGRMESVKVADIAGLYEVADSRSMREQILQALSQRKENEAVDKMIEIARRDTDPRIRGYAVTLLGRMAPNNERAKQFIKSFLEQ
jgi:TolA-binding protein/HEAT repeat protein